MGRTNGRKAIVDGSDDIGVHAGRKMAQACLFPHSHPPIGCGAITGSNTVRRARRLVGTGL